MRRTIGLLLVLYGLLLAANTTAPVLAQLFGDQVMASPPGGTMDPEDCSKEIGYPPLAGLYGHCSARWPGVDDGSLFGQDVLKRTAPLLAHRAYTFPLIDSVAVLPLNGMDKLLAAIAVVVVGVGGLLVAKWQKVEEPALVDASDDRSQT